jgi:hypothetical protein
VVTKALLGGLNRITVWYRERETDTEASRAHIADEITTYLIRGLRTGTG